MCAFDDFYPKLINFVVVVVVVVVVVLIVVVVVVVVVAVCSILTCQCVQGWHHHARQTPAPLTEVFRLASHREPGSVVHGAYVSPIQQVTVAATICQNIHMPLAAAADLSCITA